MVTINRPMFASFLDREWALWAWPGAIIIVLGTWYQVQVDVAINEWFGSFYDMVQKALATSGAVMQTEFFVQLLSFFKIAGIYVIVAVLLGFFTKHWVFRWRTAMNDFYTKNWDKLYKLKGHHSVQKILSALLRLWRASEQHYSTRF